MLPESEAAMRMQVVDFGLPVQTTITTCTVGDRQDLSHLNTFPKAFEFVSAESRPILKSVGSPQDLAASLPVGALTLR